MSGCRVLASHSARSQPSKPPLGIAGTFNRSGNDGTITRFGWKAQNKSLLIFAGEAYNVEQGVTNENFPNERDDIPIASSTPCPRTDQSVSREDQRLSGVGFLLGYRQFRGVHAPVGRTDAGTAHRFDAQRVWRLSTSRLPGLCHLAEP